MTTRSASDKHRGNGQAAGPPRVVATFDYLDERGALLFQALRYEPGFHGERKTFRQRRPMEGGARAWALSAGDYRQGADSDWRPLKAGEARRPSDVTLPAVRLVLYRLPELLAAPAGQFVFIVEGEGKVEALRAIDVLATCAPMGAGKWRKEFGAFLAGRHVVILPDNDGPGRKHGKEVAEALQGVAASVRVYDLPDLPPKGDIVDWLKVGGNDKGRLLQLALAATEGGAPEQSGGDGPQAAEGRPKLERTSAASRLVELVSESEAELFRTGDQASFARLTVRGHREVWPLRSRAFRTWLRLRFYEAEGRAVGAQAVEDALGTLDARALFDGQEHAAPLRVAEAGGRIYLDLADPAWRVVEIDTDGWRVLDNSPVRFRRPKGLLPLPVPTRGGSVGALRNFVNVGTDEDFRLLVGWLVQALRPQGPYPVLCFTGQHGSAKSTAARVVRSLIDPSVSPLRKEPRDDRDLMIAASNAWAVAFDNLSHVPPWLSDALCRLATGGGFSTRELYTDGEEVLFDAVRPCVLTSIEDLATRGDLLDRCVLISLPEIPKSRRRPERLFWPEFEAARPGILGALLDAVSGAMGELHKVRLDELPRMADFAEWATAAESALGWPPGAFVAAYTANRDSANDLALDADVIVGPLRQLIDRKGEWKGTASELLAELNGLAEEATRKAREWPGKPNVLSGRLKRLAPNLREAGYGVLIDREPGAKRSRFIRLERRQDGGREASSRPSSPSRTPANPAEIAVSTGTTGTVADDARDGPRDDVPAAQDTRDGRDDASRRRPSEGGSEGGWTAPGLGPNDLRTPW
jgi:hypothetical protein